MAAQALLERGCMTDVQALNEFANVARRKLGMTWEVHAALADVRTLCRGVAVGLGTLEEAFGIAQRHGLSMFDGLIVAAAPRSCCTVLQSEDMQDGTTIAGRLRIVDPFRQP